MNLNEARKIAGLPEQIDEAKDSDKTIKKFAKYVIEVASDMAEHTNGEVDTDGIRDHLQDALSTVSKEVADYIKTNKMDRF